MKATSPSGSFPCSSKAKAFKNYYLYFVQLAKKNIMTLVVQNNKSSFNENRRCAARDMLTYEMTGLPMVALHKIFC